MSTKNETFECLWATKNKEESAQINGKLRLGRCGFVFSEGECPQEDAAKDIEHRHTCKLDRHISCDINTWNYFQKQN